MLHVCLKSSVKLAIVQVFVELEIPHVYHTVARNSPKRQELVDKWDVFQVPYIEVGFAAVTQKLFEKLFENFSGITSAALPSTVTVTVTVGFTPTDRVLFMHNSSE